ncbi:MAG: hypothetical protein Kow0042_12450 [Calditrichia bacterium]
MNRDISSISLQEDFLLWVDVAVRNGLWELRRALSESLPVSINQQTYREPTTARQIAKQLSELLQKSELDSPSVRLTLPGRFFLVKKVKVPAAISPSDYQDFVAFEFEKIWNEDRNNYHVYLPEFSRQNGHIKEILALAIRKEVLGFIEEIAQMANLNPEIITPAYFTVEEFFRKTHPDLTGLNLLLGWQRHGYDIIISDEHNFVSYQFRPYNTNFDDIDKLEEEELISGFEAVVEEIQHPPILDKNVYSVQGIYLYGFHFKPSWMALLKAQVPISLQLFNLDEVTSLKLQPAGEHIKTDQIHQFIEPISNVMAFE